MLSFEYLYGFLNCGGVYAIEDIHTFNPKYKDGVYIDSDINILDYLDKRSIEYDVFFSKMIKKIPALVVVTKAGTHTTL